MFKLLVSFLFLTCGCSLLKSDKNLIIGVNVSQVFPNMSNQGKLWQYETPYVNIYYYNDYMVYDLSYDFDSTVNNQTTLTEERRHVLVYRKGQEFGYDFNQFLFPSKRKVPMDSIFKLEWVFNIQIYPIMQENQVKLKSSVVKSDGTLSELFELKGIADTSMSGTIQLEYSRNMNISPFSLSKEMNALKNMKLFKVHIVNNDRYYKQADSHIDRAESRYEIKVIIPEEEKLKRYIKIYEKDMLTGV